MRLGQRVALVSLLMWIVLLPAQSQSENAQLHQALLDLTNPWTVMCVAAHPDDEDGSSLTVLRRKYGVHTVSLFSTFGEGGQNAVGPELYEELGVIRARETIAAAEVKVPSRTFSVFVISVSPSLRKKHFARGANAKCCGAWCCRSDGFVLTPLSPITTRPVVTVITRRLAALCFKPLTRLPIRNSFPSN